MEVEEAGEEERFRRSVRRPLDRGDPPVLDDDVVDGTQSLKSRGENDGLVYRTVPHTVRFEGGKRYRVSFRYENEKAGQYAWVTAVDEPDARELSREALPVATTPTTLSYEFTAPADGEAWVGLRKVGDDGKAEFVLDAFEVREA